MFFKVVELVVIFIILFMVWTEIIWPALQGKALFPLFRDEGKLWEEDAELEQQRAEEELRQAIAKKQASLNELKEVSHGSTKE